AFRYMRSHTPGPLEKSPGLPPPARGPPVEDGAGEGLHRQRRNRNRLHTLFGSASLVAYRRTAGPPQPPPCSVQSGLVRAALAPTRAVQREHRVGTHDRNGSRLEEGSGNLEGHGAPLAAGPVSVCYSPPARHLDHPHRLLFQPALGVGATGTGG